MRPARDGSHRAAGGFTFVELLIVGLIVVVVVGGMCLALTTSGVRVWALSDSKVTAVGEAQRALDRIAQDLHQAKQANLTCAGGQLSFDPVDNSGRVTYSLNGTARTLVRQQGTTSQIMGAQLSNFQIPTCAGGLVRLLLTTQVTTAYGSVPKTFMSQVWVQSP